LAASISVVCRGLLRCVDSGVRCTVLPVLFWVGFYWAAQCYPSAS
jgi:hypothetical protein